VESEELQSQLGAGFAENLLFITNLLRFLFFLLLREPPSQGGGLTSFSAPRIADADVKPARPDPARFLDDGL